jgi:hypothetical protein
MHMATAKRLYLYGVSGVGLTLGLSGAVVMLHALLANIGFGPAGHPAETDKAWFVAALGLMSAGLLVWLIHWNVVERMVEGARDEAAIAERRSIVRSVYFASVMGGTLYVAASELVPWLARVVGDMLDARPLAGASQALEGVLPVDVTSLVGGSAASAISSVTPVTGGIDDSWSLSIILVAAAAWAYHAWIRDRDLSQTPLISGAAAWVSRLYLYGAALVSLIIALDYIVHIARVIIGQWAETSQAGVLDKMSGMGSVPVSEDWVRPVLVSLVAIAAWGAIWAGHWLYSERLRTASGQQASAERGSRTRLAFMALVIFWAAATVVSGLGDGLGALLASLLDAGNPDIPTWYLVVFPVVAAVPAAVAAWWYRQQALAEDGAGGVPNVSADRVILYTVAVVGMLYLTTGAANALMAVLTQIFTEAGENAWKVPVAGGLGIAVGGAVAWAWPWMLAQARRLADWQPESVSSSRNYYLYLVLGVAVTAGALAMNTLIQNYGGVVLSLPSDDLADEVIPAIAIGAVAVAVIAYHYWILSINDKPPAPKPVAAPAAPAAAARPTSRAGAKPKAKAAAKPRAKAAAKPRSR